MTILLLLQSREEVITIINPIKGLFIAGAATVAILATAVPAFAVSSDTTHLYGPVNNTYTCADGGAVTPNKFGRVRIRVSDTQVLAKVVIRKGLPNTTYEIWLNQNPGDCPTTPTGSITTNGNGHGWTWVLENKVPGATKFWVSATGGTQVLRSPAVDGSGESDE